jgi:hypothetical protein
MFFGEGWDSIAQKGSTEVPIFSRRDQFFGLGKDVYKALLMEETLMNVIYDYDFECFDTFSVKNALFLLALEKEVNGHSFSTVVARAVGERK